MLTLNSRIRDIYKNPVGHDVISRVLLQLNKKESLVKNPVIGSLKLKTVSYLVRKTLGPEFFSAFLKLLNQEQSIPKENNQMVPDAWWNKAVFYQIYPRSFMDSNGDGIGDLKGIIQKLDYLKELGVDCLWLSPIFDSPNDDNGYDIRDYRKIMPEFGSMKDFELLLSEVHKRNMRLILDLVVNHTSDEHPWFQEALKDPASEKRDYYYIKEGEKEKAPNNWKSFFSGSAWNYYEKEKIWGLHLFSKKQMDLNWDNKKVRQEVSDLVNFWLGKGVDGFRMDVINYISKAEGLPDGDETLGKLMEFTGIEHYFYGPHLHEYLKELMDSSFEKYHAFRVGETPGIGMQMGKLLTGAQRGELSMIFNFDQLETGGHTRFDDYRYDLNYYKKYIISWENEYGQNYPMSLFFENHDNPRMTSKVNPDPAYRNVLSKLLGALLLTLKGTPFLFQGEEYGAVNQNFKSISELRDVESLRLYKELSLKEGKQKAFSTVLSGTRDHARTPVAWDDSFYGGFTTKKPWIFSRPADSHYNILEESKDADSVLSFYKQLIALRKKESALSEGTISFTGEKKKNFLGYYRTNAENQRFYIECNLSDKKITPPSHEKGVLLLSNYKQQSKELSAYQVNIYRIEN